MTAIVGIQTEFGAVIAGDSLITYNDKPYAAAGQEKVVERGEYLIAFAGDDQAANIANYIWIPPKVSKVMDPDKFMMTRVLPSLRKTMLDNGYNPDASDKDAGFDALIAINGIIYEISHYYTFSRDDRGVYAVGAGGALALGAAVALKTERPESVEISKEIAREAIQISADYNTTVGGEITVKVQRGK